MTADLFGDPHENTRAANSSKPLAARIRPRSLDDFVGQEHIIGQEKLLRRAIEADKIDSMIFYGPPGCGKTTLAEIIAKITNSRFVGLKRLRAEADRLRSLKPQRNQRQADNPFHRRDSPFQQISAGRPASAR